MNGGTQHGTRDHLSFASVYVYTENWKPFKLRIEILQTKPTVCIKKFKYLFNKEWPVAKVTKKLTH